MQPIDPAPRIEPTAPAPPLVLEGPLDGIFVEGIVILILVLLVVLFFKGRAPTGVRNGISHSIPETGEFTFEMVAEALVQLQGGSVEFNGFSAQHLAATVEPGVVQARSVQHALELLRARANAGFPAYTIDFRGSLFILTVTKQ